MEAKPSDDGAERICSVSAALKEGGADSEMANARGYTAIHELELLAPHPASLLTQQALCPEMATPMHLVAATEVLSKAALEDAERPAQKAAAKAEEEAETEAADTANAPTLPVPDPELTYAEELGQLASMGFPSRSLNVSALQQASGDVQTAMDWLLAQQCAGHRLCDRSQQRTRRADVLQGQASADAAELVEAARNAEWEKVEVRRPQEAVFSSECGPLRAGRPGLAVDP
jgi:hypothetical protein